MFSTSRFIDPHLHTATATRTAEEVTFYRPISLLPILSKLFEKLFLARLKPILQETRIIPDHHFGFRQKQSTVEQVHRITNVINKALQSNKHWTAALLDSSQAFDKVWHEGLLYLLTPWCRVFLEKLTDLQLVKKFLAFHRTRRFITALTSVRHLSLSWASPIQSI